MSALLDHRRRLLEHRLDHMRKRGESGPFQTFVGFRELGVRDNLAKTLNNASLRYGDRAALETTREGRVAWLDRVTAAIEKSVAIYYGCRSVLT